MNPAVIGLVVLAASLWGIGANRLQNIWAAITGLAQTLVQDVAPALGRRLRFGRRRRFENVRCGHCNRLCRFDRDAPATRAQNCLGCGAALPLPQQEVAVACEGCGTSNRFNLDHDPAAHGGVREQFCHNCGAVLPEPRSQIRNQLGQLFRRLRFWLVVILLASAVFIGLGLSVDSYMWAVVLVGLGVWPTGVALILLGRALEMLGWTAGKAVELSKDVVGAGPDALRWFLGLFGLAEEKERRLDETALRWQIKAEKTASPFAIYWLTGGTALLVWPSWVMAVFFTTAGVVLVLTLYVDMRWLRLPDVFARVSLVFTLVATIGLIPLNFALPYTMGTVERRVEEVRQRDKDTGQEVVVGHKMFYVPPVPSNSAPGLLLERVDVAVACFAGRDYPICSKDGGKKAAAKTDKVTAEIDGLIEQAGAAEARSAAKGGSSE